MSAARRGAVAATVLLLGFVALLLSPATLRADSVTTTTTTSTGSLSTQVVDAPSTTTTKSATLTTTTICTPQLLSQPKCNTYTISGSSTFTSLSSTTETTTASTLTYAVLPGNVSTIPPTATPKPPPTPRPSPAATTDTGITALGTDTGAVTSEFTQASTVINPQPGGDSSSVLPLTVLAFLVIIGGGAFFLITRLR
jgi:hypothetical protein